MPLWLCCCFYSLESKHNKLSECLLSVVMINWPTSKPQHFSFLVALVQQETLLLAIYVKQYTKYTRHIWQLFVVLAFFLITKKRINILRKAHVSQSTEHNYICQLTNIYLFNSPTKGPFMELMQNESLKKISLQHYSIPFWFKVRFIFCYYYFSLLPWWSLWRKSKGFENLVKGDVYYILSFLNSQTSKSKTMCLARGGWMLQMFSGRILIGNINKWHTGKMLTEQHRKPQKWVFMVIASCIAEVPRVQGTNLCFH